jgi:hypothetical protein
MFLSNNPGNIKQMNRNIMAKIKSNGIKIKEYFNDIMSSNLNPRIRTKMKIKKKHVLCVK